VRGGVAPRAVTQALIARKKKNDTEAIHDIASAQKAKNQGN
jgi:hypothetical protein